MAPATIFVAGQDARQSSNLFSHPAIHAGENSIEAEAKGVSL
jgi:hypothetical protein